MKNNLDDYVEYLYVTGQLDDLFKPKDNNQEQIPTKKESKKTKEIIKNTNKKREK